jgi:hypothetical protein
MNGQFKTDDNVYGYQNDMPLAESTWVNVYPNPANSTISIYFNCETKTNGTFTLYNINGKQVLEAKLLFNNNILNLDISHLPKGLYFYKTQFASCGNITGKLQIN